MSESEKPPFDTNEAAKKAAKAIAWPSLMRSMSDSGIMACNPKYVASALDKLWPEYLFYAADAVDKIYKLVSEHPGGIDGLRADIKQANREHMAAFPMDLDM